MANHDDVMHALGMLQAEVSGCREDIKEIRGDHKERLNHHSGRLGSLEASRAKSTGVLAFVGAIATALGIRTLWEMLGG